MLNPFTLPLPVSVILLCTYYVMFPSSCSRYWGISGGHCGEMTKGQAFEGWEEDSSPVWAPLIAQHPQKNIPCVPPNSGQHDECLHARRILTGWVRGCAQPVKAFKTPISPAYPVSRNRSNRARSDTTRPSPHAARLRIRRCIHETIDSCSKSSMDIPHTHTLAFG